MLSIMLNFPVSCSRERVAVNMQGTVFTLARLKIVPSYYQGENYFFDLNENFFLSIYFKNFQNSRKAKFSCMWLILMRIFFWTKKVFFCQFL